MSLQGKTVLITRPEEQSNIFIEKLKAQGAIPYVLPLIEITPPDEWNEIDAAIERLDQYQWLILSSVNGAKFFIERMISLGIDLNTLKELRIAVVGKVTQEELEKRGIKVDFVPSKFVADTIGEELPLNGGEQILFPRSHIARKKVIQLLTNRGAQLDEVVAYQTKIINHDEKFLSEVLSKKIDYITFTSASCVNGYRLNLENTDIQVNAKIACIGPITKKAAEHHGIKVDIMAEPYTVDGLINKLLKC